MNTLRHMGFFWWNRNRPGRGALVREAAGAGPHEIGIADRGHAS